MLLQSSCCSVSCLTQWTWVQLLFTAEELLSVSWFTSPLKRRRNQTTFPNYVSRVTHFGWHKMMQQFVFYSSPPDILTLGWLCLAWEWHQVSRILCHPMKPALHLTILESKQPQPAHPLLQKAHRGQKNIFTICILMRLGPNSLPDAPLQKHICLGGKKGSCTCNEVET